jgi:hypothetical protein
MNARLEPAKLKAIPERSYQLQWDALRLLGHSESRLEGGVNRAKLKFSNLITTTSRVSVRNIIESTREGAKQIASE